MYKRILANVLILFMMVTAVTLPGTSQKLVGEEKTKEVVFEEDFTDGAGIAKQSGGAKLEVVEKTFEGNIGANALSVSNRSNDYDAVDLSYTDLGLDVNEDYHLEIVIFVDGDVEVPGGAQSLVQFIGVTPGNEYGDWISNKNFVAGDHLILEGKFNADDTFNTLRVQSNSDGATVPFSIGSILITKDVEEAFVPKVLFEESFSDKDQAIGTESGGAKLEVVEKTFDGNIGTNALSVSNRSEDYHAVDFFYTDLKLEANEDYYLKIVIFVDENIDVPEDAQSLVQFIGTEEGNEYGDWVSNKDFVAGNTLVLEGKFKADDTYDRLRVQSNPKGATVPFYIGSITILSTEKQEDPVEPTEPAKDFTKITFEDEDFNGFVARGEGDTPKLTVTSEANKTDAGKYALKVEDRKDNWHGPSLNIEDYIEVGSEYKISLWVKLISPNSANLQLSTQVGSEDYGASYNNLEGKTVSVDDDWVKLEATYRYTALADNYITIYVESTDNKTASFYIDDVNMELTDSSSVDIEKELEPIKNIYKDHFLIGNAVSTKDFEGQRLELLKQHHNLVTAENAMKPGYAYDDDLNFDFAAEDNLVKMTKDAGLMMHGHVLVWHQQSNDALHTDSDGNPLSREIALKNLRTHIKTVVENFADEVISWDVVNEAMIDNPPNPEDWQATLRKPGWLNAIGPDYIKESFIAAKEVIDENGWDIKLFYNDYNDDNQAKATAIYNMVKDINEEYGKENNGEKLIDGIGMQGHYNLNTNPANVRSSLERFISLGVEVGVTELDVTAGSNNVITEQEANQQAYLYARLFQMYKEHSKHISRVTLWGLDDGASWRSEQNPLLFDANLQAKKAYYAIVDPDKFIEEYDEEEVKAKTTEAMNGTPIMDGEIDAIWEDATVIPVNLAQQAWDVAQGKARALWDEENLYVMVEVSDSELDKSSDQAHEQDSVEVFIDEENTKAPTFVDGVGQYRVNFDNEATFNPGSAETGFESRTIVSDTENGYVVEMKIPFKEITPEAGLTIGFDVQVNDAKDGSRAGVSIWNDLTGQGFQDASVFGNLLLKGEEADTPPVDEEDEVIPPVSGEDDDSTDQEAGNGDEIPGTGIGSFKTNIAFAMLALGIGIIVKFNRYGFLKARK